MKKIFILIFSLIMLFSSSDIIYAQKKSSYKFKTKSYSNTYKVPKLKTNTSYKKKDSYNLNYDKPTYKSGSTTYIIGDNYKSSGLPKVKRSSSAKNEFLKSKGLKKVPEGYEVDHIIPLSKGGQDVPSNMQLLPKEVHKQKTANERKK